MWLYLFCTNFPLQLACSSIQPNEGQQRDSNRMLLLNLLDIQLIKIILNLEPIEWKRTRADNGQRDSKQRKWNEHDKQRKHTMWRMEHIVFKLNMYTMSNVIIAMLLRNTRILEVNSPALQYLFFVENSEHKERIDLEW